MKHKQWLRQLRNRISTHGAIALLMTSMLAGCGGADEGTDNTSPLPPSPVGGVTVVDGFGAVRPNTATRVDLSAFVRGPGATLTSLQSEQPACGAAKLVGLTAELTISASGLCRYAFTAGNGATEASASLNMLASSKAAPVLPPLSQAMTLDGGDATFDLEALLGTDWPAGYSLDAGSLQVQGGSVQGSATVSGNRITYTPPATPDWNRIVFILKDAAHPNEDALGSLYITVSDTINQPPIIGQPKYDYQAETGTTLTTFEDATLDLASLPKLDISEPDGRDWQLVEVQSYSATVTPVDPTSVTNKQFTFTAGTLGTHIVSYIVADHEGGFASGLIKLRVGPKEHPKDWADITVDDQIFHAPPLHSEATAKGVIAEGVWDNAVNLADTPPGNTIAGMADAAAHAYCNGQHLASRTELDRLRATTSADAERARYPVLRDYLVTDGSDLLSYALKTGQTAPYLPTTSPTQYVICVTDIVGSNMSYTPTPDTPAPGYENTAISDGATWWPLGQVTSEGGVGDQLVMASSDQGTTTLDASNFRLTPADCAGDSCTLEVNADKTAYGSATLRLVNGNNATQALDIGPVTFWQDAGLFQVTTGDDGRPADGIAQNTIIATLVDNSGAPVANTEVKLIYQAQPQADVTITPAPQVSGTTLTTDGAGQVTLALTYDHPAGGVVSVTVEPVVSGLPMGRKQLESTFVAGLIGNFIPPDPAGRTWTEAVAYCQGLSPAARLPTVAELQTAFVDNTSAEVADNSQPNDEMCSLFGWPLSGQCGGITNLYWTGESNVSGFHYSVNMNGGHLVLSTNDTDTDQVVCVR